MHFLQNQTCSVKRYVNEWTELPFQSDTDAPVYVWSLGNYEERVTVIISCVYLCKPSIYAYKYIYIYICEHISLHVLVLVHSSTTYHNLSLLLYVNVCLNLRSSD